MDSLVQYDMIFHFISSRDGEAAGGNMIHHNLLVVGNFSYDLYYQSLRQMMHLTTIEQLVISMHSI